MLKSIVPFPKRAAKQADPDAIRGAREAAGLTREELADLNGVLPLEVAAWESGAIALSPYEGEKVHWTIQNAEHERRLAGLDVPECPWLAERLGAFDAMAQHGPGRAAWAARTIAAHRAGCDACLRASRDLPAAPEFPRPPGAFHWIADRVSRLPGWLRLPVQSAQAGLVIGASIWGAVRLTSWVQGPDWEPQASAALFLLTSVGAGWFALVHRLLQPLGDRSPYLAGQLCSAAVAFPAALALALTDVDRSLYDPLLWIWAVLFVGLIGLVLGDGYDPDGAMSFAGSGSPEPLPAPPALPRCAWAEAHAPGLYETLWLGREVPSDVQVQRHVAECPACQRVIQRAKAASGSAPLRA